jgi:hypothetical protein
LIVPVWNDDGLVVDLVSGLQVAPELVEWVWPRFGLGKAFASCTGMVSSA